MAKRIPKHILKDKIGDDIIENKAIKPKGKKGSRGLEQQARLISQFMATAKNSRRPSEPTLLQKLIAESVKRKRTQKLTKLNTKKFSCGNNISKDTKNINLKENESKLNNLLTKFY